MSSDIPVQDMIDDKRYFKSIMYKAGQVKTQPGTTIDDEYIGQLEIIKLLGNVKFDSTVMDDYNSVYCGHKTYEECMQVSSDPNLMILLEMVSIATVYSDPDDPYDKGFLNLLKMFASLYKSNPYVRDRIGWMLISIVRRANVYGYFPVIIKNRFDPRLWHRPGEVHSEIEMPKSWKFAGRAKMEFGPDDDIWNYPLQ